MKFFHRNSRFLRYLVASAYAAAAVLLRLALFPWLGSSFPFFIVYPSVLLATRFGGVGPGVFCLLAGAAGTAAVTGEHDPVRIVLLAILAGVSIWVIQALRRSRLNAEDNAHIAGERLQQLREEAAQRIREEGISARLRAVVESSQDAILSTRLDGTIESWNHGAEQVFGYSSAEALGRNVSFLIPADRRQEEESILDRIRHGEAVKPFETVRCRKGGKAIPVSLTVSPVLDSAQKIVGASQIARDVTEQKELQEQLRQSQKLESLGVLAGGLAHDFNNLLTGILGNASLALDSMSGHDPARIHMTEILDAGERAALLVRQMTAYAGKGRYVVERVDLSAEVRGLLPLVRPSVSRLVELDLDLEEGLPQVEADRVQLQQLIMNLTINAAEAIGEQPGTIAIRTCGRRSEGERQVILEVSDTGPGMDAETKARAFDPFFTTKFPGRGLGLAAVMGIIRAHRGSISVESAPGKGSKFVVMLPGMAPKEAPSPVISRMDLRGDGEILVVDDEELIQKMAQCTLERYGYKIELASDGKQAVEAFAARPTDFAAVLLDLTMPVMNGEEALDRIRQIRPDVPVLLSSGFSEAEAARRFENRGLAGFLQKPYTATVLASKVRHAVAGKPQ